MRDELRQELCEMFRIPEPQFSFLLETRSCFPHSQLLIHVYHGHQQVGVAKVSRSGSGAFFLRREWLMMNWICSTFGPDLCVKPIGLLSNVPGMGVAYPYEGEPVGKTEAVEWLRKFQATTLRRAITRDLSRATISRRVVANYVESKGGYQRALDVLAAAVNRGVLKIVPRHGDVVWSNILETGRAIDWCHFRTVSLLAYDALYSIVASDDSMFSIDSKPILKQLDRLMIPTQEDHEVRVAEMVVSLSELAYQAEFRARIAVQYGAAREADDRMGRLQRIARQACEEFAG